MVSFYDPLALVLWCLAVTSIFFQAVHSWVQWKRLVAFGEDHDFFFFPGLPGGAVRTMQEEKCKGNALFSFSLLCLSASCFSLDDGTSNIFRQERLWFYWKPQWMEQLHLDWESFFLNLILNFAKPPLDVWWLLLPSQNQTVTAGICHGEWPRSSTAGCSWQVGG